MFFLLEIMLKRGKRNSSDLERTYLMAALGAELDDHVYTQLLSLEVNGMIPSRKHAQFWEEFGTVCTRHL